MHSEKATSNFSLNTAEANTCKETSNFIDFSLDKAVFKKYSENNHELFFVEEINIEDVEESEHQLSNFKVKSLFGSNSNSILQKNLFENSLTKIKQESQFQKSNTRAKKQSLYKKFEVFRL